MANYTDEERAKIRKLAQALFGDDAVEIDMLRDADLSVTDSGMWVRGWLWVSADELEGVGVELKE